MGKAGAVCWLCGEWQGWVFNLVEAFRKTETVFSCVKSGRIVLTNSGLFGSGGLV